MLQWKEKVNRGQFVNAEIMAAIFSLFKRSSAPSKSVEEFLPFRPETEHMTADAAAHMLAQWVKQAGGTIVGEAPTDNGKWRMEN